MKLRTSQFLVVLASLIPFLVISIILAIVGLQVDQAEMRRAAIDRVRAVMVAVDTELNGIVGRLQTLATSSSLERDDLAGFSQDALRVMRSSPDWLTIILLTPDGKQVMNTSLTTGAGLPKAPTEPGSFARAVRSGQPVIGNVARGVLSKQFGLPVRVPVFGNGELRYVLTASVKPELFERLLQAQHIEEGTVLGLVDSSGHFVARVPYLAPSEVGSQAFMDHARSAAEGWYRGATVEGNDTFTAHITSPLSGWMLGHAIPAQQLYAGLWRDASLLIGGIAIAAAIAVFFALWLSRRITRPLLALAGAAEHLGKDVPTALATPTSIDEIGRLAEALARADIAIRERQQFMESEAKAHKASDEAKTQFLAMLSHELRNPLAALTTATDVLKRSPSQATQAQVYEIIERQTRQMTHLIEDLLDLSRIAIGKESLRLGPVDLLAVARDVVGQWQLSGRAGEHRLELTGTGAWISGDAGRLEQVLSNLIDNAVKFSPGGTTITVAVRSENRSAVISVQDEGEGIATDVLPKVFDLFAQGTQDFARSRGGLGIGLAVVKRLVELHRGTVEVGSGAGGRGTTVTLRLPSLDQA